jgi:Gas vesicle synthesis protein GvpL/GvpF
MNDRTRDDTWVYGLVPSGARLRELERRSDRLPSGIRVVESGDLAVIVGDPPAEGARATRDRALDHARLLEAAILDAPVVPFRFGTMVDSRAVASELLDAHHDELARLLQRVRDHVQFILKVTYREEVVLREIVERDPEIARLREETRNGDEIATRAGRLRLGELVSIALDAVRQNDADAISMRLAPHVEAFTLKPPETEFMVLNAPFLVERRRMRQFEEAVAAVVAEQAEGMHFVLLGPMPAYDFVDSEDN